MKPRVLKVGKLWAVVRGAQVNGFESWREAVDNAVGGSEVPC